MDREAARNLAQRKMRDYGLLSKGWHFRFSRGSRLVGSCNLMKREITMSGRFVDINDRSEVLDTILHEIAHALVERVPGEDSHGRSWREMARLIGAKPSPCTDPETSVSVPHRYIAVCPVHGELGGKDRWSKAMESNRHYCKKCGNKVTWRDNSQQLQMMKRSH